MKSQLSDAIKAAMKARETLKLSTLRMAVAEIKKQEIDRGELDDAAVVAILRKLIKQRHDAAKQFTDGGRDDLAAKERDEVVILEAFCPQLLSAEQTEALVHQTLAELGASGMADMGRVMAALKAKAGDQLDMAKASPLVKSLLG